MRRSDIDAALAEIYAQIPDVGCKGLCADACGPIDGHPREFQRIHEETGQRIPHGQALLASLADHGVYVCPALDEDKRCTVYEHRPYVCRLWGASEALRCPYGCRPVDGRELLTRRASHLLTLKLKQLGGEWADQTVEDIDYRLSDPEYVALDDAAGNTYLIAAKKEKEHRANNDVPPSAAMHPMLRTAQPQGAPPWTKAVPPASMRRPPSQRRHSSEE